MVFIVLGGICLGCCCLCWICGAGSQWCRECFGGPDPEIERIRREMEERQPQISTRLGGWAPAKSTPVNEKPAPKTLMQERMDRLEKTVERLEGEQHHTQENVVLVQLVDFLVDLLQDAVRLGVLLWSAGCSRTSGEIQLRALRSGLRHGEDPKGQHQSETC